VIIGCCGWQDSGKTLLAQIIAHMCVWVIEPGVKGVVSNVKLPTLEMDGRAIYRDNAGLRGWLSEMVGKGFTNYCVLIDEVDRVFPARFWGDRKQSEDLMGVWQDEKCGNVIIYTAHMGVDVDKLLRGATRMLLIPEYNEVSDVLSVMVCDGRYGVDGEYELENASRFFKDYDRWARVV